MSQTLWCRRCRTPHDAHDCPRTQSWRKPFRDPRRKHPVTHADRRAVRARPFCEACHAYLGDGPGGQIDHIIPISEGGTSRIDNLQRLCVRCHAAKTRAERRNRPGKRL